MEREQKKGTIAGETFLTCLTDPSWSDRYDVKPPADWKDFKQVVAYAQRLANFRGKSIAVTGPDDQGEYGVHTPRSSLSPPLAVNVRHHKADRERKIVKPRKKMHFDLCVKNRILRFFLAISFLFAWVFISMWGIGLLPDHRNLSIRVALVFNIIFVTPLAMYAVFLLISFISHCVYWFAVWIWTGESPL